MVELTNEERKLDYVKYFNRPLAEVAPEKRAIASGAPLDPSQILPFEDRNKFLDGTHGLAESGFGIAANGTGYVANKSFLPGVTSDMMDWWFAWHPIVSDLRYKLWHHDAHYFARADKVDYILDPKVPMNQKTWGVAHSIKEDIGGGAEEFIIHFMRPADAGLDESIIGTKECQSLVVGVGEGNPAYMVHKWYEIEGGLMLEDRFWMGYGWMGDGKYGKVLPDGIALPEIAPRGLFNHGCEEFTNLGSLLPELYVEYKDKFQ